MRCDGWRLLPLVTLVFLLQFFFYIFLLLSYFYSISYTRLLFAQPRSRACRTTRRAGAALPADCPACQRLWQAAAALETCAVQCIVFSGLANAKLRAQATRDCGPSHSFAAKIVPNSRLSFARERVEPARNRRVRSPSQRGTWMICVLIGQRTRLMRPSSFDVDVECVDRLHDHSGEPRSTLKPGDWTYCESENQRLEYFFHILHSTTLITKFSTLN